MAKTEKIPTKYPGVRYREHKTRKHGVNFDRYFFIRYKLNGKDKEEGVGWASAGFTAEKANKLLAQVRENIRSGNGPQTLAAMREELKEEIEKKQLEEKEEAAKKVIFSEFFENSYFPEAKSKKKDGSLRAEFGIYKLWLSPVIGNIPLLEISYSHIEKIMDNMTKAGRSKRSKIYALSVISQVWSYAKLKDITNGDSPSKKFKLGKLDNERKRFLTEEEAQKLLDALGQHSINVRDMAKLSLFCGLRAGEIFKLKWADIDLENGTILLSGTKAGNSRYAYITPVVQEMLEERMKGGVKRNDFVFPSTNGQMTNYLSKTFERVVQKLGLNEGITDPKQKVVFHTLRHTFASWLSQRSVDLYTIQNLMGHSEYRMVQRYAHLNNQTVRNAVSKLDNVLQEKNSENSPASGK